VRARHCTGPQRVWTVEIHRRPPQIYEQEMETAEVADDRDQRRLAKNKETKWKSL
jgi:hypothetical protein